MSRCNFAHHHRLDPAQCSLESPPSHLLHRGQPHFAIGIVDPTLDVAQRAGTSHRCKCLHRGEPVCRIGVSQELTQPRDGGLELEPSAQGDHGREGLGFSLPQESQHFVRTGLRQPLRRRFQESTHLGRGKLGQPDENRLERGRPQLAHQLAQVLFSWRRGGFVDGLKNLSQDTGIAESGHESIEPFPLILLERLVPPYNESRFLQERGDGLEVAGAEHVRQVGLERGEHVSTSPVFLALLEDVEQDRNDVGPQILLILLGDRVADPRISASSSQYSVESKSSTATIELLGGASSAILPLVSSGLEGVASVAAPPPPIPLVSPANSAKWYCTSWNS